MEKKRRRFLSKIENSVVFSIFIYRQPFVFFYKFGTFYKNYQISCHEHANKTLNINVRQNVHKHMCSPKLRCFIRTKCAWKC